VEFNDLLGLAGIDPSEVVIARHRPHEPALNRVFPWIVTERPDLFRAYQQFHAKATEGALKKAKYFAAFIRHGSGRALYAGMYRVGGCRPLTHEEFWLVPENQMLRELGMAGLKADDPREHILQFDMQPIEFREQWKGRLVIEWPGLERSWYRWADRNRMPVLAITEDNLLVGAMPPWDGLKLTWKELNALPSAWCARLAEWRGIYFIFDEASGRGYVGSAYGGENILGRWRQYGLSGHGGNRRMRGLDPTNFRFTILQRLSPDTPSEEVIRIEGSWKDRLHTRSEHGLNDN